ncbi:MAG: hypothetical protein MJ093_09195 [Saccharofermentans sp.]|nr:hypothetical protein [Saccharofermentans sp.]
MKRTIITSIFIGAMVLSLTACTTSKKDNKKHVNHEETTTLTIEFYDEPTETTSTPVPVIKEEEHNEFSFETEEEVIDWGSYYMDALNNNVVLAWHEEANFSGGTGNMDDFLYQLVYINDDNIPELVINENNSHSCVFTIYNDRVVHVSCLVSTSQYAPRQSSIATYTISDYRKDGDNCNVTYFNFDFNYYVSNVYGICVSSCRTYTLGEMSPDYIPFNPTITYNEIVGYLSTNTVPEQ